MSNKPAESVTLREVTADNLRTVLRLSVADDQKGFVATNAISIAQAYFAPEAWFRAICLGEEIVGFVMIEDQSLAKAPPAQPTATLWRLMIDQRFQKRGIGREAVLLVIEHVRAKGYRSLFVSYVPEPGGPEMFYKGLGFRDTGRVDEGEVVLELAL